LHNSLIHSKLDYSNKQSKHQKMEKLTLINGKKLIITEVSFRDRGGEPATYLQFEIDNGKIVTGEFVNYDEIEGLLSQEDKEAITFWMDEIGKKNYASAINFIY